MSSNDMREVTNVDSGIIKLMEAITVSKEGPHEADGATVNAWNKWKARNGLIRDKRMPRKPKVRICSKNWVDESSRHDGTSVVWSRKTPKKGEDGQGGTEPALAS